MRWICTLQPSYQCRAFDTQHCCGPPITLVRFSRYPSNAFKTSSVFICADGQLEKVGVNGNYSFAAYYSCYPYPGRICLRAKRSSITYSRIDQPRVIPVHTKVRESIFKLGPNVIDLLSREGWFNTAGKIFFNSQERCLLCKRLRKVFVALAGSIALNVKRASSGSIWTTIECLPFPDGRGPAQSP